MQSYSAKNGKSEEDTLHYSGTTLQHRIAAAIEAGVKIHDEFRQTLLLRNVEMLRESMAFQEMIDLLDSSETAQKHPGSLGWIEGEEKRKEMQQLIVHTSLSGLLWEKRDQDAAKELMDALPPTFESISRDINSLSKRIDQLEK